MANELFACSDGSTLSCCIPCASVEEYIVAALATKPHRQMAATSAATVGMASFASHMEYLLLSIRHPSRQKEQVNAVTEGIASGRAVACDQSMTWNLLFLRRRPALPGQDADTIVTQGHQKRRRSSGIMETTDAWIPS